MSACYDINIVKNLTVSKSQASEFYNEPIVDRYQRFVVHVNCSLFLALGHQGIFLLFSQNLSTAMQEEFPFNKIEASGRSGP